MSDSRAPSRARRQTLKSEQAKLMRLHKVIARSGLASLRKAERMIQEGRVALDGETVIQVGLSIDPSQARVTVDGKPLQPRAGLSYLKFYKPKGYITTRADEKSRATIYDLIPPEYHRLNPAGRLDARSEGLLLLTNDGALLNALISPRGKVRKVYLVKLGAIPSEQVIGKALRGASIGPDNRFASSTRARRAEKLRVDELSITERSAAKCWARVTLTEGKNRHLRRLFQSLGLPIVKLKRIEIGPLKLGNLQPGEAIHLTRAEESSLKKIARARTPAKRDRAR